MTQGDGTTTSLTYDAAGRRREVRDSAGGALLNAFDDLDRLVAQTTELGTVAYQYDARDAGPRWRRRGRRRSDTLRCRVTADAADPLTQGSRVAAIEHDPAGRRTRLALPNGMVTAYEFDAASQLTALRYSSTESGAAFW